MTGVHAEAHMLMRYACVLCARSEIIFNARDASAPYEVQCSGCGANTMRHVDWHRDVRAPERHVPAVGERMFLDASREALLGGMRAFVAHWWDHPSYPMREHDVLGPLGREGAAEWLAEQEWDRHDGHVPSLVVVDAALHAALTAEASDG